MLDPFSCLKLGRSTKMDSLSPTDRSYCYCGFFCVIGIGHKVFTYFVLSELIVLQTRNEYPLEKILNEAAMEDRTVILTTLNEAWAAPNSVIDLFLESFRIGVRTRRLLNHLVIIALDQKAFVHCQAIHTYCFLLVSEGNDFHEEAFFMTPLYLKMMWRRIDFLRSVLEMGYNFVFTVCISIFNH